MKKILDFIIIFLLVFLAVSFFSNNQEQNTKVIESGVILKAISNSYTVPAGVELQIENNTKETIKVDICKDLTIKHIQTDSYLNLPESFCKNNIVEIKPTKVFIVDYSSIYEYFKVNGNYIVKATFNEKETIAHFEVNSRGSFTKLFIYLFYAPAYNLIIYLVQLFNGSLGWAIVGITIILRIILLWPQHKMLVSQKKLQTLQPKIKKIQEEFKGQPQVLGKKMMELYKTEKVNPMGSCGFLLIQMPILLVIYNVILHIEEVTNHFYLYSFLKDFDFNSMDFSFFGVNLLGTAGWTGLFVGLTVGLLQFIQIWLSFKNNPIVKKDAVVLEKKKGATDYSSMMPDPAVMQKAMLYGMPAMVAIFTFFFPVGLGLYWGISTLFMIIQQLIVNRKK